MKQTAVAIAVLWLWLGVSALTGQEQSICFEHVTLEHGLSQTSVNCMVQDQSGFLWFGTQDGLNRYDGYEFVVYKHEPGDASSLRDNNITALLMDHSGNLWLGTLGGGLAMFDPTSETFRYYPHDNNDTCSVASPRINALCLDGKGGLWVGTDRGLDFFDREVGSFTHLLAPGRQYEDSPRAAINALACDSKGMLWIGTALGLQAFSPEQGHLSYLANDPSNLNSLSDNYITVIYPEGDRIWVGTRSGGLNCIIDSHERVARYQHNPKDDATISHNDIRSLLVDTNGELWVGTHGGGLNHFLPETGAFARFQESKNNPTGIWGKVVHSLYEDSAGNIWAGTLDAGANRFKPGENQFGLVAHSHGRYEDLLENDIRAFCEDDSGNIWVGTFGGLYKYDRRSDSFSWYGSGLESENELSSELIYALTLDAAGKLWVGTRDKGVFRFDPQTAKASRFSHNPRAPASLSHDRVNAVRCTRDGAIWVGTEHGLNRFDASTTGFHRFYHIPGQSGSLSNDDVRVIHETRSGELWIGTRHGGLNHFLPETQHFARYQNDPTDSTSLSDNRVFALHEDREGLLWVGTRGSGLNRINPETGDAICYTEKDGLPNNVVYGILEDAAGHLWLSTNKGLSRFDPKTERFKNYDATDGLQSAEFNFGAFLHTRDGAMLFGGIRGFNLFYPNRVQDNPFVPPIKFTDFRIFNRSVPVGRMADGRTLLYQPITATQNLTLSHKDYVFSLEFAALNYAFPKSNQYAFKLEGFEDEWNEVGNRRYATYTALPPGNYTFRVQASNNDGVWNEVGASLGITVHPPIWRTWWFRSIGVCLLFIIVLLAHRTRTRNMTRRNRILEQRVKARTRELEIANQTAQRSAAQGALMYRVGHQLSSHLEIDSLLTETVTIVRDAFDYYHVMLLLLDDAGKELVVKTKAGSGEILTENLRVPLGRGMIGFAAREGVTRLSGNVTADPHYYRCSVEKTCSELAVPIKNAKQVMGVLDVQSDQAGAFDEVDVWAMETLSTQIATAIENARLYHRAQTEIGERQRAEEELKRAKVTAEDASLAKSDFLANMSHEIRTPLNAIIGMTDLALETGLSGEQRSLIRTVASSSEALLSLINDILDFSKIEAGRLEVEVIAFDLRDLVEEIVEILSVPAQAKGLELVCFVDPGLPNPVMGDPTRIRQILINLGGNAIKFTESGEVVFRVAQGDEKKAKGLTNLHFSVSDSGIGIEEQHLHRIFSKFSQADSSTTREFGGTGLGLSICHSLVELMGGEIWVESELGVGSTFHFCLLSQPADPSTFDAADFSETASLAGASVLIIDDNQTSRESLLATLTGLGAQARAAASGPEGLSTLRSEPAATDVVLVDSRMPDMDGAETAALVQASPELGHLKLFMMCSRDNHNRDSVNAFKGDGWLAKPVRLAELTAAVFSTRGGPTTTTQEHLPESENRQQAPALNARVLLVEDNRDNQVLAEKILEGSGCMVQIAENGQLAIEALQSAEYDIILMDIQMPVMDGFEATCKIRRWERQEDRVRTPIIALTAHALEGYFERCIANGMDDYATKPIKKRALLSKMMELLTPAPTILIVDDSPDNRKLLQHHVAKFVDGKQVFAHNGQEAVELFQEQGAAVILLDMEMPVMSGYEAARAIRELKHGAEVPIIALTAHRGADEVEQCLRAGCTEFIAKPVRKRHVESVLKKYLPSSVMGS